MLKLIFLLLLILLDDLEFDKDFWPTILHIRYFYSEKLELCNDGHEKSIKPFAVQLNILN